MCIYKCHFTEYYVYEMTINCDIQINLFRKHIIYICVFEILNICEIHTTFRRVPLWLQRHDIARC